MPRRALLSWLSLGTALFGGCARELGEEDYARLRERMVSRTIEGRGVKDPRVLRAMRTVRRHEFVPAYSRRSAYVDDPLPIGWGQTISQPYIVAYMTEAVLPAAGDRCLEVGTGSGYQAAVLAELCARVLSIEYFAELETFAERNLRSQGYGPERVELRQGDGYQGWREAAPFRVIVVTAAPRAIPQPLLEQLDVGGRLVAPVGPSADSQELELWTRTRPGTDPGAFEVKRLLPVSFVPLLGH
jgi:protein-L-isoaspartate(D-aspartate) O-methyltransferase